MSTRAHGVLLRVVALSLVAVGGIGAAALPAPDASATPLGQTTGFTGAVGVSAGSRHSLALKEDGTVWGWGSNVDGQLGDGPGLATTISFPVQVIGITAAAVAAGYGHSLAVDSDGTVWAWGRNGAGQLGDGTNIDRSAPERVTGLSDVRASPVAIAAGLRHSLALKNDGTVWAWGDNSVGELGDGTTTDRNTPVQVSGLDNVIGIAAGASHNLAVRSDGTVWAWGSNDMGQLGNGDTGGYSTKPIQVSGGMTNARAVAAGLVHSLAVKDDGTVWAWGDNGTGQLGDGTTVSRTSPVQVSGGMVHATVAAAGSYFSLALKDDGTVWAWGDNLAGQLGNGCQTTHCANASRPVQVASGLSGG